MVAQINVLVFFLLSKLHHDIDTPTRYQAFHTHQTFSCIH